MPPLPLTDVFADLPDPRRDTRSQAPRPDRHPGHRHRRRVRPLDGGRRRGPWEIENGLHWVFDVVFREDRSRIRAKHAGADLALIRRVAVSLLRRAPGKGSGVTKRLKAGWDDSDLRQVIQGITARRVR